MKEKKQHHKEKTTTMPTWKKVLAEKYFAILSGVILIIAFVLRFYDYPHRWTLASDQAGFALSARYAIEHGQIPLLGPFSSAGPFQTGGEWYWMVMLGKLFYFNAITSPWVFMTILSIVFVGVMIALGTLLWNKKFGLLTGLLAAISTGQIIQAPNLTNQTPLMLFSAAAIYCSLRYSREKKMRYLFFLGLSAGFAASVHLQGVAIAVVILFTILANKVFNPKHLIVLVIGGLLPWVPVFLVDMQHDYYTFTNMFAYYFFNKNPISYEALGRRWMTFAGVFVPSAWAYTIGGYSFVSYITIAASALVFMYSAVKRTLNREWLVIFFSAALMIILLRYTRTPIFESYFIFIHPFILLISAWCIYKLFSWQKAVGVALFLLLLISSLYRDGIEIHKQRNEFASQVHTVKEYLKQKYPGKKFAVYDYQYETTAFSLPLTLYLYEDNLIAQDGVRIGIISSVNEHDTNAIRTVPVSIEGSRNIMDVSGSTSAQLKHHKWVQLDPDSIYHGIQHWFK